MKKMIKKSTNAILSLALILTLSAAIFVPNTSGHVSGISPMSDIMLDMEFFI